MRFLLLGFLTILGKISFSQTAVSLDKLNVLYFGVENPISIVATEAKDDNITVTIDGAGATITKYGSGKYGVRVNQLTDECKINIILKGKVIGSHSYRVRAIPNPEAFVGGRRGGSVLTAGEFRVQAGVGAGVINFPFELNFEVVSFLFSCSTENGSLIEIPVIGNKFNTAVTYAMQQHVKAGSIVIISDVRVKGPDDQIRESPSLLYYIK